MSVRVGYDFHVADDAHDLDHLLRTDAWAYLEGVRIEFYHNEELRPRKRIPENVLADVAGILDDEAAQDLQRKWENLFVTSEGELTDEEVHCLDFFLELRNVLCECAAYQEEAVPFHAYLDGSYFGSVCLFLAVNDRNAMFQGITKSLAHSLVSYFYPERSTTTKLNSLLIPALEDFCRQRGMRELYVAPVGRQGQILTKWYGFLPSRPIPVFPSDIILGAPGSGASAAPFYVKHL